MVCPKNNIAQQLYMSKCHGITILPYPNKHEKLDYTIVVKYNLEVFVLKNKIKPALTSLSWF